MTEPASHTMQAPASVRRPVNTSLAATAPAERFEPAAIPQSAPAAPTRRPRQKASSTPGYVELHARSAFSFLEGASLPEGLLKTAHELGLDAMALLDRNGVYGAARFHTSAKANGLRAHIGAEIAVSDLHPRLTPPAWLPHAHQPEPARIPVLCATPVGYSNLSQLITRFKMREPGKSEGAATLDDVREFAPGLIALTGGDEGPLAAALVSGGEAEARRTVEEMTRIFGHGNVYVELQRHGERAEECRNQAALRIADRLRLPVLATNGVCYATQYEREILDVFTAIRHGCDLERAGRLLAVNSQRQLRSARTMRALFRDLPEAVDNTLLLSSRLEFEMGNLGYRFPEYTVPAGDTMDSFLRKRVDEGIRSRYSSPGKQKFFADARRQADRELELISRLGFAGYFLIVWDIVRYCKTHDILIQGRGSAANSVVCYALEITAVDPIEFKLLFERFLNENRDEWPDVDLDLPSGDKREEAIQYVYRRYGELGAAMTANVITYRGKSAAREVGKALGFDEDNLGRLSGLIGQWEWRKKDETLKDNFAHAGFDLEHRRIAKYVELCERVQDLPRHLGQHSGGMVICQDHLNRCVPIERASMVSRTVVQWDKEDCGDMGMVKVDLLGLGMMAVIKDCIDLVPKHYGQTVDIAALPEGDPEVYDTLCRADTVGLFQVESRAQMASIPRNAPRRFYDLVVQVAIIRPGPIVGKMMHPYMRRRQGKEKVTYPVPELEPVLERTLGVPLFQEQLLRMAMIVGRFTGTEADELRKAVGMRRSVGRMKALMEKLRDGMTLNGISPDTQEAIVGSIQSFALYGFPESHAASFALLVYASTWFKVKHLAAFTCAMLNNQPMGFYMPAVLVKDAQRHGLRVKPVDVTVSRWECTVEHEPSGSLSLRLGLMYCKGMRQTSAEAIVHARESACGCDEPAGAFRDVDDLARRVPALNRRELAQLARIGALNQLGGVGHRRDAVWQVEEAVRPVGPLLRSAAPPSLPDRGLVDRGVHAEGSERRAVQSARITTSGAAQPAQRPSQDPEPRVRDHTPPSTTPLRPMTTEERLVCDYSGTGLTIDHHPMHFRRQELRTQGILSAAELQRVPDGSWVRAAGSVIARQRPGTALGFIFLSMEDETGISNVVVHPDLYERDRVTVTRGKFLLVEGRVQNQDTVVHVRAERIEILTTQHLEGLDLRSHDFH